MTIGIAPKHESSMLTGSSLAWAKFALTKLGINATAKEINDWIPTMFVKGINSPTTGVTEDDVFAARQEIQADDPTKAFLEKEELQMARLSLMLQTRLGRNCLRHEMKSMSREHLLEILDFRNCNDGQTA